MTHASTADAPFAAPPNLIRLSVGIESVEDLVDDLEHALVPVAVRSVTTSRTSSSSRSRPGRGTSTSSTRSSAASSSTAGSSPRWRIPPTTASSRGRSARTATRSTRSCSSPTRRSPAAGSACAPIGVFHMKDEKGPDEKLLCVPLGDPAFERVADIHDVQTSCATRSSTSSSGTRISSRRSGPRRAAGATAARRRRSSRQPATRIGRLSVQPEPIDLLHLGRERVIASYLLDTTDGPALFDCGPTTTRRRARGGARRARARARPTSATCCSRTSTSTTRAPRACSCASTPACRCTSRRSARRTSSSPSGWSGARAGSTATRSTRSGASSRPCRAENVHALDDARARPRRPSPRRATRRTTSATSTPTARSTPATRAACASCPAARSCRRRRRPTSTSTAWQQTLDEIERRAPERLALIHFGVAEDVARHLDELRLRLLDWAESVAGGATEEEFVEYALAELRRLGRGRRRRSTQAMPLWQSYRGLERWADLSAAAVARHHSGRGGAPRPRLPPALRGARDLVHRDVSRADRGRVRGARPRRKRDRGRPRASPPGRSRRSRCSRSAACRRPAAAPRS